MSRHPEAVRQGVRSAYVTQGLPLAEAARRQGVSPATAGNWKREALKRGDDWDRLRTAGLLAGGGREQMVQTLLDGYLKLHDQALTAIQEEESSALVRADAISRLSQALDRTMRALGQASPRLSRLALALAVLERQAEFIKERFPQHLPAFLEILEPFGGALTREYN